MDQASIFHFGDLVLNLDRGFVARGAEEFWLRPRALALLRHLAASPGRIATKDELLDAVWPSTTVSEDSLTQCVREARKAIGDIDQAVIRTVPRRGYLFLPHESGVAAVSEAAAVAVEVRPSGVVEPTVAVLPFYKQGAGVDDVFLLDAVVEEITNALTCFKTIAVLARHSAAELTRAGPGNLRALAAALGVAFLVEGSARTGEGGYSVEIRLSETASGHSLWVHRRTFQAEDVFDVQRSVAQHIASALVSNIETAAAKVVPLAPASNLQAYLELLKGMALLRGYAVGVNEAGRDCFRRSCSLDPSSGLARAYLALSELIIGGYAQSPRAILDLARDLALEGIDLSPQEHRCHRILGLVLFYRRDHAAAERSLRKALDLNPFDADTLAQLGFFIGKRGRATEGIGLIDKAVALNPLHPPWYLFDRGEVLFALGRYEEAALSIDAMPRKDACHLSRVAAFSALAGQARRSAEAVKEALDLGVETALPSSERIVADCTFELAEDKARLYEGLLRAGWPRGD